MTQPGDMEKVPTTGEQGLSVQGRNVSGLSGFLQETDPYDGLPWDRPMLGPSLPSICWAEAFEEPRYRRVSDPMGSGRIIREVPAPTYRCASCGNETTRCRILECKLVDDHEGAGGIIARVVPVLEAECAADGKRRAGVT